MDNAPAWIKDLVQYGALGVICAYFLWQDYHRNKRREDREVKFDSEQAKRDQDSREREEECHKSHAEIRKHQIEILDPLIKTSNKIHQAAIALMREKNLDAPLPILDDDETRALEKRH